MYLIWNTEDSIISAIGIPLCQTLCKVAIQNNLSSDSNITTGEREGDPLSKTIFNIVLNHAIASIDRGAHIISGSTIICEL